MTPETAKALLPLVQDVLNERGDQFYLGAFVGACDVLEKLGHITEPEYNLLTGQSDRHPDTLRAILQDTANQQEKANAG